MKILKLFKNRTVIFLCLLVTTSARAYPSIVSWKGKPTIAFENNKNAKLKSQEPLKSAFFAITAYLDELVLQLNSVTYSNTKLTLLRNSKIQVDEVSEDEKTPQQIFLFSGTVLFQSSRQKQGNEKNNEKKAVTINQIKTPFFDLPQPTDAEVVIVVNMQDPSVEIKMIRGQWNLEFFAYEKKLVLKAGEKVKFIGEKSDQGDDEVKFDFLLDERKAPRGVLQPVQKWEAREFERIQKSAADEIKAHQKKAENNKKAQAAAQKKIADSYLCHEPFGQLNECLWKMEGSVCVRQRCNASGQWGDRTERPNGHAGIACSTKDLISRCDY